MAPDNRPGAKALSRYHAAWWEPESSFGLYRWHCTAEYDLAVPEPCEAMEQGKPVFRIRYHAGPTSADGRATCQRHASKALWANLLATALRPDDLLLSSGNDTWSDVP